MGLFDFLKKRVIEPTHPLCGVWKIIRSEEPMEDEVRMTFHPDGRLIYSIYLKDRIQIMKLTFRVSGDTIISDQPSHPKEERSRFSFEDDGVLVLEHEGRKAWLKQVPNR